MSIEAMKQALEALEECRRDPRLKYEHPFYDKTITALRTAIEQAENQESDGIGWLRKDVGYFNPPAAQRTWVGLTDAEIEEWDYDVRDVVMDIEKLLRDRNT
jgi:hypothetical protein